MNVKQLIDILSTYDSERIVFNSITSKLLFSDENTKLLDYYYEKYSENLDIYNKLVDGKYRIEIEENNITYSVEHNNKIYLVICDGKVVYRSISDSINNAKILLKSDMERYKEYILNALCIGTTRGDL